MLLDISLNNSSFRMPFFPESLISRPALDGLFFSQIQDGRHFKMAAK